MVWMPSGRMMPVEIAESEGVVAESLKEIVTAVAGLRGKAVLIVVSEDAISDPQGRVRRLSRAEVGKLRELLKARGVDAKVDDISAGKRTPAD